MPELSNYTVLRNLDGNFFAINLLYGTIDELEEDTFNQLAASNLTGLAEELLTALHDRHHIQSQENQQLKDVMALSCKSPRVQFFVPLTNSCNLACPYCFQGRHAGAVQCISSESIKLVISAIVDIVNLRHLIKSNCEIVLYGGEPLLPDNINSVKSILQAAEHEDISVSIITNGATIDLYLELLHQYSSLISNITITLDGDQSTHDRRRITRSGGATYKLIYRGIEALRQNGLPCTIRINLDSDLAHLLQRGAMRLPKGKKEIHRVTGVRREMTPSLKTLLSLCLSGACSIGDMGENPVIALYGLIDPNTTFSPLLSNCPEGSVYYFSLNGNTICSCNESDGRTMVVGSYRPVLDLSVKTSFSDSVCKTCPVHPVCGGGCRKLSSALSNWEHCGLFNEIIDMIDCGLKYMTGTHHEHD